MNDFVSYRLELFESDTGNIFDCRSYDTLDDLFYSFNLEEGFAGRQVVEITCDDFDDSHFSERLVFSDFFDDGVDPVTGDRFDDFLARFADWKLVTF